MYCTPATGMGTDNGKIYTAKGAARKMIFSGVLRPGKRISVSPNMLMIYIARLVGMNGHGATQMSLPCALFKGIIMLAVGGC